MQEFELIAKTFQGLEEVLAQELTELGANNVQIGHRMVSFSGDKAMMYRANFSLRTAIRVLKPLLHFKANDADDVYKAVRGVDWQAFFDVHTTFAVDSVVYSEEFRHSKFVAYKVKDAIVDYFRDTTGERPNIRITNPDVKLHIHISGTDCTLCLDSSGDSLHLRGYRTGTVEAPINEVLAAGLIMLTGWRGECDFVDPFCGSGTLLVEAALIARNIAPGVFRKSYAFEKWKDFDADLFDEIYNDDSQERPFEHRIYGYDLNKPAVEVALANAKSAGVADVVQVEQRDVRKFVRPAEKAIMVTNPPYGERLTPPDLLSLYEVLGKTLKHEFTGNEAWIISAKQELFENLGLRASLKIQLFNGKLDCDFRKYQLFEGKLGQFRAEGGQVKTDEERRLMSDQRRFKARRDDFKQRISVAEGEAGADDEWEAQYAILSRRHREFQSSRFGQEGRKPAAERGAKGTRYAKGKEGGFKGKRDGFKPKGGGHKGKGRRFDD